VKAAIDEAGMDCRNFKDLLDSYLSGELAVETNHACLRHAEQCSPCRAEMGARRNLRDKLREVGRRTLLSEEVQVSLRARLQAEATQQAEVVPPFPPRPATEGRWSFSKFTFPLALTAALLLTVGLLSLYLGQGRGQHPAQSYAGFELSQAVMDEAAGDHRTCASHFAGAQAAAITPAWMKEKYPAYAQLAETAAKESKGLQLNAVHVCSFKQRKFGHLVYSQGDKLISLLVTPRDEQALRAGKLLADDGLAAGLQHVLSNPYQVSAYQTAKYVVLVVSEFSETENKAFAVRLAEPVSAHLRQIEKTIAVEPRYEIGLTDLLASLCAKVQRGVTR
jgi:anti-sigma factor RsiW